MRVIQHPHARVADELEARRAAGEDVPTIDRQLRFTGPSQAFLGYLKVALVCGLFVASPFVAIELWRFVAEGLYAYEKFWVRVFGPLSFLCFGGGVAFGYFFILRVTLPFLYTYAPADVMLPLITFDDYHSIFVALTLLIGHIFELPIVLAFLGLIGVVDTRGLRKAWRYYIFAAVIVAAVITPTGDPLTLAVVTAPLLVLYAVSILLVGLITARSARSRGGGAAPRPRRG